MTSINISKEGEVFPGFLYGEKNPNKFGVVIIQEIWGVTDPIKYRAKELSEALQCKSVVPDLYRGKVARKIDEATHFRQHLDWKGAIQDVEAAARALRNQYGCSKVGVVGFCMGGALALAASVLCSSLDAAVCFYGVPSEDLCDLTKIKIPVQCHFGDKDHAKGFSDPETARSLKEKLERHHIVHEFYTYPNAGHAFMNPPEEWDPEMREMLKDRLAGQYDEESRKVALNRMLAFFKQYLS
ncbi:hypothetical protein GpartN1_g1369.t1 [Galdieria partita]|uniref:Dienelactone hydrolase domain-containing protein n=1 Tax=Galdieria partita TaxID=83374 RepID=A0A9C7UN84_9RHOD|nr:hypothetical protein GpartN1_g1369.t1 [Galdieria partita]